MKTAFKFMIAATAAISVFSSCRKELLDEAAGKATDGVRTISVQFDNSTKACFDGLTPKFENNDKIRVSNATESEERQVSVDGSGNATFTTSLSGALTAIYPADAAVLGSGEGQPIVSPYFKVPASQDGKAIIAKAGIAEGSSDATFSGQTAVFEITPPSGATSITITSLRQIGTDGQRSGTAVAINDDTDGNSIYAITVAVPAGGKAYVSFLHGVNLTDLSFDAGANYGMKGIPMKDITARATSISEAVEAVNATAVNTKYTIDGNNWHPYVIIDGKKWATMNIGATETNPYGTYFAWGDVTGQTWNGSAWSGSGFSSAPNIGNPATLPLEYDAANVNWGGTWRMPTKAEFDALGAGNWVTSPGKGRTFGTSPNTIFLPAAGAGIGTGLLGVGDGGYYWSSSLNTGNQNSAFRLLVEGNANTGSLDRYYGLSVRALSDDVTPEPTPVLPEGALEGVFSVSATKKVHFSQGNLYCSRPSSSSSDWTWHFYDEQYKYNSLSTGSSRTATAADTEIDLFTWGYSASTSLAPTGSGYVTAHPNAGDELVYDKASSEGGDDWGVAYCESNSIVVGTWRTLTIAEWQYLFNTPSRMVNAKPCISKAIGGVSIGGITYKGLFLYPDNYNGDVVSSSMTWNQINEAGIVFLPTAGYRSGSSVRNVGTSGTYSSSTADSSTKVCRVDFWGENVFTQSTDVHSIGISVRLVTDIVSPTPEPANPTGGIGSMERTDGAW